MTNTKQPSFRIFWPAGLALTAFVVAGVIVGAKYLGSAKETPRGSYALGKMTVGEELMHEFVIPNPFGESLALDSVHSSHSDAKVVFFDKTLPGHGQGIVRVRIRPTEPGPLQAKFSLEYRGERRGLRSASLHGEVMPPELPAAKAAPNPELLLEASKLLGLAELKEAGGPVIVDLRPQDEYQRSRIPQSVNMSSTQLKASRHLKSKSVVLVEEGAGAAFALDVAAKMQAAGFASVHVLKGGIASWQALGAPVVGPDRDLPALLSPASVLDGLGQGGWRVVDARTSGKPLPFMAEPAAVPMAKLSDAASLQEFHKSLVPSDRVLILTDTGRGREQMREFTGKFAGVPVYFARDGAAGINREYARIVHAGSIPAAARLDATATVSSRRISRSLGGCSSCP